MVYMIAILMASLSFLLNRLLLKLIGPVTVISVGPALEEAAKTLFAYYLGSDIIAVHVAFGGIEAIYDWCQARQPVASLLSLAGHSLFGAVTAGTLSMTDNIWLGLAAGIMLHLIYNVTAIRLFSDYSTKKTGKRDNP